jgi:hypothetical protein
MGGVVKAILVDSEEKIKKFLVFRFFVYLCDRNVEKASGYGAFAKGKC